MREERTAETGHRENSSVQHWPQSCVLGREGWQWSVSLESGRNTKLCRRASVNSDLTNMSEWKYLSFSFCSLWFYVYVDISVIVVPWPQTPTNPHINKNKCTLGFKSSPKEFLENSSFRWAEKKKESCIAIIISPAKTDAQCTVDPALLMRLFSTLVPPVSPLKW